ncbi:MAG: helix-turn-helix domain-containing protein [Planctomycetota bacterium]
MQSAAPNTVPILGKALRLIEMLASDPESAGRSIQQLAEPAGLSTTSCFRVLRTLEASGWAVRDPEPRGGYRLSLRLLPLLGGLAGMQRCFDAAQPELERLAESVGMGTKLSIREGMSAVTVARAEPAGLVAVTNPVGSRFGLALGATGAALLSQASDAFVDAVIEASPPESWNRLGPKAFLRRIEQCRAEGFCVDVGSYHPQLGGFAVPVQAGTLDVAITATGLLQDVEALDTKSVLRGMRRVRLALQMGLNGSSAKPDASPARRRTRSPICKPE